MAQGFRSRLGFRVSGVRARGFQLLEFRAWGLEFRVAGSEQFVLLYSGSRQHSIV